MSFHFARHDTSSTSSDPSASTAKLTRKSSSSVSNKTVIVFTSLGSKNCARAKFLLRQDSISFTAIDIHVLPDRYKKAVEHTKHRSVPLIFFGKDFKGGLAEFEDYMMKNDRVSIKRELAGMNDEEVEDFQPLIPSHNTSSAEFINPALTAAASLSAIPPQQQQQFSSSGTFTTSSPNNALPAFLSLPFTPEEQRRIDATREKREKEISFFERNDIGDLTFIEPSSQTTFTYTQLLHYLRYDPKTCVKMTDHGTFFTHKCRCVRFDDLWTATGGFLKSLDGVKLSEPLLVAYSRKLAIALVSPAVQMMYDVDKGVIQLSNSNKSTGGDSGSNNQNNNNNNNNSDVFNNSNAFGQSFNNSLPGSSNSSSSNSTPMNAIKNDTLFCFTVDAMANGAFGESMYLNCDRLACSFQMKGDSPLDISTVVISGNFPQPRLIMSAEQAVSLSRAIWKCQDDLCVEFRDTSSTTAEEQLIDYGALFRKNSTSSSSTSVASSSSQICTKHDFANTNKNWRQFKDLAALLHAVDLKRLSDKQKIAFGINLYNSALRCGLFEFEIPWSNMQKLSYFGGVGFFIGGGCSSGCGSNFYFCLNDLENGFLRGNRRGVTDFFSDPFSEKDPRLGIRVRNVDYRIHFGLNCATRAFPNRYVFSAEKLDEELDAAARSFIQSCSKYDAGTNKLTTIQVLKWYSEDFEQPSQNHNTQDIVLKYLYSSSPSPMDRRRSTVGGNDEMMRILDKNGGKSSNIGLVFSDYDWTFDAKKEKNK